ncbi:MAG: SP_1767 family glycosyltransferase [Acutalibacteraceae bacterium]
MKKFLLFFWNLFFDIKSKVKDALFIMCDKAYTLFHKAPDIMTNSETVEYILKTGCSVSRFGDGEIKLMSGKDIRFQHTTPEIQNKLCQVIGSDNDNLLVCLPAVFDKEQCSILDSGTASYWKNHLAYYRKKWYKNLIPGKKYGNAFISRNYMSLKDKETGVAEYFELVKKIWDNQDIIVVEGEKSRLGMGNDLFKNAKSVRRILAPSTQCFNKYDELLAEIKKHGTEPLYILALGPTASALPYDLCDEGYRAIDMGNIDTEYEWYRMKAKEKTPIKNKLVYEAGAGAGVGEADDPEYLSQIISKVL